MPVAHGEQPEVLLAGLLAGRRELGHRADRGGLGLLAAGVGVHLGVEHQHVDVAVRGEDVVEAAVADVVGPAVAADRPHRPRGQRVGELGERPGVGAGHGGEPVAKLGDERRGDVRRASSSLGARSGELGDELGGQRRGEGLEQGVGSPGAGVEPEAQAEPELGVVLEQRVAPRRPATVGPGGVGGGGEVGAVDRRAARGVGDHEVVAEELGEGPDVGGLAAAGAGPGELEGRGQQRQGAGVAGDGGAGKVGDLAEEVERLAFAVAVLGDRRHVDGLALGLGAVLGGTDLDAEPAAGAVVGRDLHGVGEAFELGGEPLGLAAERRRCAFAVGGVEHLGDDGGVGADHRAAVALHAQVGLPDRDLQGDGPLLEAARPRRPGAVGRERADRELVAVAFEDEAGDALHEVGGVIGHRRSGRAAARSRWRGPRSRAARPGRRRWPRRCGARSPGPADPTSPPPTP